MAEGEGVKPPVEGARVIWSTALEKVFFTDPVKLAEVKASVKAEAEGDGFVFVEDDAPPGPHATLIMVFITGVAGVLGSHLADALLADDHVVTGCDSLVGGDLSNVPHGARVFKEDCNDFAMMKAATRGVDVVVHCAAHAHEGLSVFSPHLITQNIVTATTGVLSASIANGVKRFVFLSSMARYGHGQYPVDAPNAADVFRPFEELEELHPVDPYGIGKVCAEQMVKTLCEAHGVEWSVAVPHNIIGPRQRYDDPYRNVASIFTNLMLQNRQPFIYGDGSQKRCFSFISDVVAPLKKLCFAKEAVGEVFNLGPDAEFVTILELAQMIAGYLDFNLEPIFLPGRPLEVPLANCSSDKARGVLGYVPECGFRGGIHELVEWISKRGSKPFRYHLPLEIINDKTPKTWKERLM
jgi:UDP-glucose 4-epimerase